LRFKFNAVGQPCGWVNGYEVYSLWLVGGNCSWCWTNRARWWML